MDNVQPQPPDLKAYADRLEALCRAQSDEIERLRAVVAKLTGTDDAHSTLRRMYLDETLAPTARVRAAQAALGVEKASLKPVAPAMTLVADADDDSNLPLAELVEKRRARCKRLLLEPPYRDLPKEIYSTRGDKVFVFRSDDNGDNGDNGGNTAS